MKKIKYLFLFGIIGTFIGSCFSANPFWYNTIIRESNQTALPGLESYNYYNTMYTYDYQNGYQYYLNGGFCSYSNYLNFTFDCNGLLNSGNYLNSNLDNFVAFWNSNMLYNRRTEKFINHQSSFDFDLSGNIRYSILDCMSGSSTECIQNAYLFFSNSGEFGSLVSSEKASYIHLIGSNYNKNPGILGENKMNHYYFITSKRISSDYGSFYDIPNSYIRKKFYNGLNHTISSISYNSGGWLLFTSTDPLQWSYNESDNIYRLISTSYTGYLVLGVNNYLNGITQNGTIVLSMSGGNILYNYYNSYSPYLNVLSNLTPQDKGYFGNSSLFGSFINDSGIYFEVSGTPNNGNLLIRSYLNGLDAGGFYTDYNFELVSDSNIPVIIPPIGGGGGGGDSNSNTPFVFDYNSLLINDMVICYITSGDVCPYNNFSMSGFENSFPVVNRLWDGVNGQLLMDSAKPYLTELCLNSDTINYAFCSQLDIYSGAFILFDYSNGILTYNILGDSFAVDVAVSNSGQLGSVGCYGAYCSNINVGATEYLINQDSGYYSGLFLSTGYYEDFLTLNKTGFFLKCPYSYDNQNVVVGKNLLSKLGGFDLFVPINCMIAGFNAGKSFTMIDWGGFKDLGPIMKFTDDPDGNHKILFTFIDVLLSVAIVVVLMKFYHLLK